MDSDSASFGKTRSTGWLWFSNLFGPWKLAHPQWASSDEWFGSLRYGSCIFVNFYDIILCASLVWRSLIHCGESGVEILAVVGWIASVNFISMLIYIWCHFHCLDKLFCPWSISVMYGLLVWVSFVQTMAMPHKEPNICHINCFWYLVKMSLGRKKN